MGLDPRTPVVVGVGQLTERPGHDGAGGPEPVEMMAAVLRAAAEDCGHPALLERVGRLAVVSSLSWRPPNPPLGVAQRLGLDPAELVLSTTGGNAPQSLMSAAAGAIARGEHEVVAVTGAERVYTLTGRRRSGSERPTFAEQPADTTLPESFGVDHPPATDLETARGLHLPVQAYPLFENALRHAAGWSLEDHRQRLGRLWASFSEVAATNPYAWLPTAFSADELVTPSPKNRPVAFPYTKLCTANLQVDQAAAFICCSVEAARSAGVAPERWVFPLAGADANDHWFLSERADLHSSPAIRLAGRRTFELAGVGVDDVGAVDLYSCFPSVVRIGATELGLPVDDPSRPLTVTGGLTFAGGPGNNYVSHSIATMVERLRAMPGAVGLVTALGWYATKHAIGLYASRPPVDEGRGGYRWEDVQAEVDARPKRRWDAEATGPVRIESYTVTYDRDGVPELGIVVARTADDVRAWGNVRDPGELETLVTSEGCGRPATLDAEGVVHLI